MFGRRRKHDTPQHEHPDGDAPVDVQPEPGPPPADTLLAAVVAHHLDGGSVEDGTARAVSGGLVVGCSVNQLSEVGSTWTAACFFLVSGTPFGPTPTFASISGYGATPEEAVVSGGHLWADMLTSLLRAAVGVEPTPGCDVDRLGVTLDGRRFALVVTGVDRGMSTGDESEDESTARVTDVRTQLGGAPWLLPGIVRDDRLPLVSGDDVALVSLFVAELPTTRIVELKVHGADWDTRGVLDRADEHRSSDHGALLRELALLVPLDAPVAPTRAAVQRTLDGLAARREPHQAAGWPGWWTHGGVLGAVLTEAQVTAVETRTGPLPDDVRHFLTHVAGPGAGPGYGLLPPEPVHGAVPLAHAGCGNTWVLRLDDGAHGTVWMDAAGSDETLTQVAPSFTRWFSDWLDAAVRDRGPWVPYDVRCCAPVGVIGQLVVAEQERAASAGEPAPTSLAGRMGDGALSLTGGGKYLPVGALDPCHGCVTVAGNWSLPPTVFAPGMLASRAR
jgi:hypothetical protein